MSYAIANGGFGPLGIDTISIAGSHDVVPEPNFNIGVTKAQGGYIIAMSANRHSAPDYHIIPENKNFHKELGKIISIYLLSRS